MKKIYLTSEEQRLCLFALYSTLKTGSETFGEDFERHIDSNKKIISIYKRAIVFARDTTWSKEGMRFNYGPMGALPEDLDEELLEVLVEKIGKECAGYPAGFIFGDIERRQQFRTLGAKRESDYLETLYVPGKGEVRAYTPFEMIEIDRESTLHPELN